MVLNKQEVDAKTAEVVQEENHEGAPPVGFEVIRREFAKDKIAIYTADGDKIIPEISSQKDAALRTVRIWPNNPPILLLLPQMPVNLKQKTHLPVKKLH